MELMCPIGVFNAFLRQDGLAVPYQKSRYAGIQNDRFSPFSEYFRLYPSGSVVTPMSIMKCT